MAFIRIALCSLAGCMAVASCGRQEPPDDPGVLRRAISVAPQSLDPHYANTAQEMAIAMDLFEGLYAFGPGGNPALSGAAEVEVSADELTWTFRLRTANWSDGERVTADDYVFSLRRALRLDPPSALAPMLHVIAGARAYAAGDDDALAVRAVNRQTLEIKLAHVEPHLPEILALPIAAPVPEHVVVVHSTAWTDPSRLAVNGPYVPSGETTESGVQLMVNPAFGENEAPCFHTVEYQVIAQREEAFAAIVNNGVDIATNAIMPREQQMMAALSKSYRQYEGQSTIVLAPNAQFAPFDDLRVRQALALAINVEELAQTGLPRLATPAYRLTPPAIVGSGASLDMGIEATLEERRTQARERLVAAGFHEGRPLQFVLSYPASPISSRLVDLVRQDIEAVAPWVSVELRPIAPDLHLADLSAGAFQVAIDEKRAQFNDPTALLQQFLPWVGPMNHTNWTDVEFTALYEAAQNQTDPAIRRRILSRAERLVMSASAVIPLVHIDNFAFVNSSLSEWTDNQGARHPSYYLCRRGPGLTSLEPIRE